MRTNLYDSHSILNKPVWTPNNVKPANCKPESNLRLIYIFPLLTGSSHIDSVQGEEKPIISWSSSEKSRLPKERPAFSAQLHYFRHVPSGTVAIFQGKQSFICFLLGFSSVNLPTYSHPSSSFLYILNILPVFYHSSVFVCTLRRDAGRFEYWQHRLKLMFPSNGNANSCSCTFHHPMLHKSVRNMAHVLWFFSELTSMLSRLVNINAFWSDLHLIKREKIRLRFSIILSWLQLLGKLWRKKAAG